MNGNSKDQEGAIQIMNFTRWSTKDLCGRILDSEDAPDWYELKMKICIDEATGTIHEPE